MHVVADPLLLFLLKLDVEQLDKELDGGALQEDGEEDHGKAGGDKELAIPELNIENDNQLSELMERIRGKDLVIDQNATEMRQLK